ncbi:hypothetical protein AN403_1107 [Pseudomonas fluorescens]|uniref:Uncharacterized protein n=1 Tax=Pseudomonas fluorescens TaxID=294 RepID=A0A0N8NV95_PSEFL|nr:hypothetical protein AN403_1107 [Pseudomonas fluorescens]
MAITHQSAFIFRLSAAQNGGSAHFAGYQGAGRGAGSNCRPMWQIKCAIESALRNMVLMRTSALVLKAFRASSIVWLAVTFRISLPVCLVSGIESRLIQDLSLLFHWANNSSCGVSRDSAFLWNVSWECRVASPNPVIVFIKSVNGRLASRYVISIALENR